MQKVREYINNTAVGYVRYLPNYPEKDDYLQICLYDTTISIEKGRDPFYYRGYDTLSKRSLWYVINKESLYINKGFTCYKKAIKEALLTQKKELQCELTITNNLINKL